MDNVVIVPGANSEKCSIQVHWRLAGEIPQQEFDDALQRAGVPQRLLPSPPGDAVVLKRAMVAVKSGNRDLVRALNHKGGFSLVHEDPEALDLELEELENSPKNAHKVALTAKVERRADCVQPVFSPPDHPLVSLVTAEFNRQRGVYNCSTDLSVWLTQKIIPYCNGLSGRERGGFYYIPEGESVKRFQQMEEIVSSFSLMRQTGSQSKLLNGIKFYKVPVMSTPDAVEAIIDSLVDECDKVCDEIGERLDDHHSGKKEFRNRGIAKVQTQAKNIKKKVELYSNLLGDSLDDLKDRIDEVSGAITNVDLHQVSI